MFETEDFRQALMREATRVVREEHLDTYDGKIIDILQFLATANEEHLILIENKRPSFERKDTKDALRSASVLLTNAAKSARSSGRRIITINDLREAYKASFCGVWPFCR
jgi:hypothetical protein